MGGSRTARPVSPVTACHVHWGLRSKFIRGTQAQTVLSPGPPPGVSWGPPLTPQLGLLFTLSGQAPQPSPASLHFLHCETGTDCQAAGESHCEVSFWKDEG